MEYDSSEDTNSHVQRVRGLLYDVIDKLEARAFLHDASKLGQEEKPIFDRMTPKLKTMTYGSEDYKASLTELGPALEHHYAHNSHHPEHFKDGVAGMSLIDLIEMLADWKSAGERHADGSMERSLLVNQNRFGISPQLQSVLRNTAKELGWV